MTLHDIHVTKDQKWVLQFSSERVDVWVFLCQFCGIGVEGLEGLGGFLSAYFFFVPLHILILRIRDAAFSLLILLLWGEALIIVFLTLSWMSQIAFKTVYSTNFCAVPGRFPYPVGSKERIFPSLGGGGESRQRGPRCHMPGRLRFLATLPDGKHRSAHISWVVGIAQSPSVAKPKWEPWTQVQYFWVTFHSKK